jgi:hypothetical protein
LVGYWCFPSGLAQPAAHLAKKHSVLAANQVNLLQAGSGKRLANGD